MGSVFSLFSADVNYSTNINDQVGITNLTQTYSGTCNIVCDNDISNLDIYLINSNLFGGLKITESCTVNGQCTFNNSQSTISDIMFKARNAAISGGGTCAGVQIGSYCQNVSDNESRSYISETIQNTLQQQCNLETTNSLDNTTILAVNSNINGGIDIGLMGDTSGGCALNSIMGATAKAASISDNCAQATGKKGTKACAGKEGKSIVSYLWIIGIMIIGIAIISILWKLISSGKLNNSSSKIFKTNTFSSSKNSSLKSEKKISTNLL